LSFSKKLIVQIIQNKKLDDNFLGRNAASNIEKARFCAEFLFQIF
jgi:hypothetical protein